MLTEILQSDEVLFSSHDNAFVRFLRINPVRIAFVDEDLFLVARDIITSLGYSPTSVQYLTAKCEHRKRIRITGSRGGTCINIIPIQDFIPLALDCPFESCAISQLRRWIIDQAVHKAKSYRVLMQPKAVCPCRTTHLYRDGEGEPCE